MVFPPIYVTGRLTPASTASTSRLRGLGRRLQGRRRPLQPLRSNHSAPDAAQRHVGDLGNILAGEDSVAYVDILDDEVTLFGWYSVLGRAVVVHAGEDDLGLGGDSGSLSTGNAGGRVACCTIFAVPE
ncbi:copper/zinc superoxide dismutase isoform 5 [Penaeus vannamei]|uniref:Superoxide dismutase [Cu-Zn] n=1 Tax=Penaeus vannamei TaxID=6689 RepID=A0A3R7Q2U0_PENVA|nr:copper/zinc superoxide dismutase isoform 5 [Penaeus vannamei]